ncbi:hypothetical protein MUCCIDRAFT_112439 [Mucor lusitanicus CBS 277.49]|uniref:DDE-1 domain-containing protein n=1 Tax=Mucor lusitanicus CBS 277.49 TaxID=747725 RepID=A0A168JC20_MUCCL|nr:hypothetical protein MUCCIDRAFT_112439 [Mucor lusitanicus CBS 277.49]
MASNKFLRRKRAKQQRIEGNGKFVPVSVAVEYTREKQEEDLKRLQEEQEKEDYGDLEFLDIDIDSALNQKTIDHILKYKKGAETTLKGKARYCGTSRASLYRKKLPILEQNGGSSLEMFGFVVKKTNGDPTKRNRQEMEGDLLVDYNSATTTTNQSSTTLNDQLTTEFDLDDLEDALEGEETVLDYEEEEELEDFSIAAAEHNYKEDVVEEMEGLIPVLEERYNCMTVFDSDQQQTDRASFDLRKYNAFRYASLISYFKKRCFDKKKKIEASREVAELLWSNNNCAYCSMNIRSWAIIFLRSKALPDYKKGLHSKTFCYLNVKEVALETKKKIMETTQASFRTLVYLCNHSKLWLLDGTEEPTLLPKGSGATIMVSEFQCPCHGTMALPSDPSKTSRELFLAVQIFEELHPNCKGVFLFDNSSNHQAYSADALLARNMILKDKKIKYKLDESDDVIHKEGDRWYPFRNGKLPNVQEQIICTFKIEISK